MNRWAKSACCVILLCSATASRAPAQPGAEGERSVRPGVNDKYLDSELNVDEWVKRFEIESREVFRARDAIVDACRLKPGDRIADIGAGTGLFTPLLAEKVGAKGWVYAVDIAPRFVERLRQVAEQSGHKNVTPVLAGERYPRLPPESVDCVLICDVYHHFEYPGTTMRAIRSALKPGGRLIVIDFERIEGKSSDFVMGHVRAGKDVFRKEIQAAGLRLVKEHKVAGLTDNYCLEFTRPSKKNASGNPIAGGWYADPEAAVLGDRYWVFPTTSAKYDQQLHFDAFSSPDLVAWTKHKRILTAADVSWARRAMWAPCCVEKDGKYYLFFAANDLQRPGGPLYDANDAKNHTGGIGVAVADRPEGPYRDYLGKPLLAEFHNNAQPIDQCVFRDDNGAYYFYYGGWGHCNAAVLKDDFTGFKTLDDGKQFRELTPRGYVEGPVMFKRNGKYYFMWSQGGWGDDSYHVAYAIADSPLGPFERIGAVLTSDRKVATGAGHNSVLQAPDGQWYIVYHRRPIPNKGRDHRVTCIDKLEFDADGRIKPVKMTFEGVSANPIKQAG